MKTSYQRWRSKTGQVNRPWDLRNVLYEFVENGVYEDEQFLNPIDIVRSIFWRDKAKIGDIIVLRGDVWYIDYMSYYQLRGEAVPNLERDMIESEGRLD